jgi:hypothetical protein
MTVAEVIGRSNTIVFARRLDIAFPLLIGHDLRPLIVFARPWTIPLIVTAIVFAGKN